MHTNKWTDCKREVHKLTLLERDIITLKTVIKEQIT